MGTIVMFASLAAAALFGGMTWHLYRRERRRSDARVAALAAMIDDPAPPAPTPLFASGQIPFAHDHPLLKIAAGFVLIAAAILAVAIAGDWSERRPSAATAAPAAEPAALALLSMRHERSGDTLTVTGLVRNEGTRPADGIVATVLAFDGIGTFLASGRAPVDVRSLAPGEEAPFRVAIPGVPAAARYRVAFRNDSGLVRHVDRRRQPAAASAVARFDRATGPRRARTD
jgi:hypothetical protein